MSSWSEMPLWKKHALVWANFFLVIGLIVLIAWPHLSPPLPSHRALENETPPRGLVLSGPAGFTLLALIIAFAVYLRQVSNRAMDTMMNIHAGKEGRVYPVSGEHEHTKLKLKALLRTHNNLDFAAPFMIFLIVVIVVRIAFDVLLRFPSPPDWGI